MLCAAHHALNIGGEWSAVVRQSGESTIDTPATSAAGNACARYVSTPQPSATVSPLSHRGSAGSSGW